MIEILPRPVIVKLVLGILWVPMTQSGDQLEILSYQCGTFAQSDECDQSIWRCYGYHWSGDSRLAFHVMALHICMKEHNQLLIQIHLLDRIHIKVQRIASNKE